MIIIFSASDGGSIYNCKKSSNSHCNRKKHFQTVRIFDKTNQVDVLNRLSN